MCRLHVAYLRQHCTLILSSSSLLKEILLKILVKSYTWNKMLYGIYRFEPLAGCGLFHLSKDTPYTLCCKHTAMSCCLWFRFLLSSWAKKAQLSATTCFFFPQRNPKLLRPNLHGIYSEIWHFWRTGKSS